MQTKAMDFTSIIVGQIAKDATVTDGMNIGDLEWLVCAHTSGNNRIVYGDRIDLGGDVEHVTYYCNRCGRSVGSEY